LSMQSPWTHGLDSHSSLLISQLVPPNPGRHSQTYELSESVQVPPFWQGLASQAVPGGGTACAAEASRPKRANIRRRVTVILQRIRGLLEKLVLVIVIREFVTWLSLRAGGIS
jgi:hypothetical protein